MFYLNRNVKLETALLQKMISKFHTEVLPRLNRYKNYYDGIQAIMGKQYSDPSKPCNKTVINYCRNIADSYCGYLATPGYISYTSKNDIDDIMNVLRYNDYQAEDADFLLDALVYGVGAELMYNDRDGKTRFRLINPTQCFGVFDDSLTNDLMYFVRIYKANEWDLSETYFVDVYDDYQISHYQMGGFNGYLKLLT